MSIQVSPAPIQAEGSSAAQARANALARLLKLAQDHSAAFPEVSDRQQQAIALLQEQALPSTRDEEWRFTDLSSLLTVDFQAAPKTPAALTGEWLASHTLPEVQHRLVFVDGVYAPDMSAIAPLPPGITVSTYSALSSTERVELQPYLATQPGAEEVFTALNTASLNEIAVIRVAKNQVLESPLHLLFVSTQAETPIVAQPRVLVIAEANSALTLVEEYTGQENTRSLTNAVTEIWLGENAQVNHTRLQQESTRAFHIAKTAVSQARSSRYVGHAISFGAALSRHHFEIYQTGEQTETVLNGLTMIQGTQLADTHSAIAYTKPYGTSRQLHKTIVGDRAHAVFNGKVFVPQAAQLTDAGQLNRNLLLSPKARVDAKPQLEIVADNVKCTHGATVGQLDTDEVFYLQSRGIDADSARNLLIYAFAYEVIDQLPLDSLKQRLNQSVNILNR